MSAFVAARTEFFDAKLLRASESGIRQVVVVGAGYDGRAVRFRQPGVTFFEVDHPATQADKRARMWALGIDAIDVRFVSLDIRLGGIGDALADAGHDPDVPTFFMCEGLSLYLPVGDVRQLLESLAALAGPPSSLAIDFVAPKRGRSVSGRMLLGAARAGAAAMGERMVTFLGADEAAGLLGECGWSGLELHAPELSFAPVFAGASR